MMTKEERINKLAEVLGLDPSELSEALRQGSEGEELFGLHMLVYPEEVRLERSGHKLWFRVEQTQLAWRSAFGREYIITNISEFVGAIIGEYFRLVEEMAKQKAE